MKCLRKLIAAALLISTTGCVYDYRPHASSYTYYDFPSKFYGLWEGAIGPMNQCLYIGKNVDNHRIRITRYILEDDDTKCSTDLEINEVYVGASFRFDEVGYGDVASFTLMNKEDKSFMVGHFETTSTNFKGFLIDNDGLKESTSNKDYTKKLVKLYKTGPDGHRFQLERR